MRKSWPLALAAVAALAAGCGGTGSRSRAPSASSVADCLNGSGGFLVERGGMTVAGQAPSGVTFSVRLYATHGAAKAAAAAKSSTTTAVVGRGVVDFGGNPGVPPARLANRELSEIESCVSRAKPR